MSLLKKLAGRSEDTTWSDFATRFESYKTEPPVLKPGPSSSADASAEPIVVYPAPQDGYLDNATFTVWLSKLSTVIVRAGGKT